MKVGALAISLLLAVAGAGCGMRGSNAGLAAVRDAENACAIAVARVTAERRLPTDHVASCDQMAVVDIPSGYYVMALRARCPDDVCGSTNMGWFAVRKATAEVFEVDDLADWKLGRRVTGGA